MTLDRDSIAAHRAELEAAHSRKGVCFALLKSEANALRDYSTDNDMDVDSVHYDVDRTDEEGWESEWRAYVEDAGLKGKAAAVRVIRFLRARADTGAGAKAYNGTGQRVS